MMSTGMDSCGTSYERAENEISPHPITRTWRAIDPISVLSTLIATRLGSLLHFRHQSQALETRARQQTHHSGDGPVIGFLVGAHEDALIGAATASIGDRLQFRNQ